MNKAALPQGNPPPMTVTAWRGRDSCRWPFLCLNLMTNVLQRAGKVATDLIRGQLGLKDPDNVSSQIERSDLKTPDSEPAIGDAELLINQGDEWFEEARIGRWRHNADTFSGIAMFQGRQWEYWDEDSGSMQPLPGVNGNPDFEERMLRSQWNHVRTLVELAIARVTAAYPDSWAVPQTDSEVDKQAAQIMRAVNAHCAKITHRDQIFEEATIAAAISTTCFIECGWDAQAWADVGIPTADGSVSYHRAQIGDVCNHLMLSIDCYPDPNAALANGDIHNGAYFIKRCTRSTEFIQQKWNKTVQATSTSSTYGFLEQRLEWLAGDQNRENAKIKNCTDVTEVWNKPCKQYPQGRYWAYSGDKTLLVATVWPYEKKDKYPFVPLRWQKNQASVWGLNMVRDLRPLQIDLNKLATYLRGRLEWDRPWLFVSDACEVAPEDVLSPAIGKATAFKDPQHGGGEITWKEPPSPPAWLFEYRKIITEEMEYIAGVRDFNSTSAVPPNSGKEFELRVEQEKSRLGPITRHVSAARAEVAEWDGAFYEQFGTQYARILGVDDKAQPMQGQDMAAAALVDLRALKNGKYRVEIQPGSGQSKSFAAQEERLDEVIKVLAAPNMNPALAKMYLSLSTAIRSDKQTDDFNMEFSQYFAEQAQQAEKLQSMKGDQAQQELQAKSQQEEAMAAIELRQAQMESDVKVKAAIATEAARAQADQNVEEHRSTAAANLETLKFQNAMALTLAGHQAPPKISLAGKLGSVGVQSAEKLAGFPQTDNPAEIKAMNAPKPVAGPTTPKKKATP